MSIHEAPRKKRNRAKMAFLSADQIEEQAAAQTVRAGELAPGEARQDAFRQAAQLRAYAAMKRLLAPQNPRT